MSRTIDEKVVSMQFDNKQFERNVSTSMSTLDKLKQKLNLEGAAKGLENVNGAVKGFDVSPLSKGLETVKMKFSALEVMAVTALANITNSAVNAGKNLVKAFTIDPIKTGFQEYETQINAVQTILANTESKGTTLQQVNRALDELNTYADKTIYNFTEMTRNIGTFTAAGVDLDTSVSAIQGIANLAAVSGSTSQQASTAMYQLSQALSSGTVKLQDWNSVVNAGMGGQVFQDALKQTARVHGIAIDAMIEKEGSFRETLSKGWLTSDILTETLNQFTMAAEEGTEEWEAYKKSLMDTGYSEEQALSILKMANTATDAATKVKTFTQLMDTLKEAAQSGWTQSWEIMIGDFEEAKSLMTEISDRIGKIIGDSAEARNSMLSGGLSSGWKQLLDQGIADEAGYKEMFSSVAKEHGISIDKMIESEKKLDDSLTDSEAFQKSLTKGLKEGTITSDMFSESVYKLADKMSNMSTEELKAAGYTVEHVKQTKELASGLKDGSISMDEFTKKMMRPSGRENIIQALWNSFDALMGIIAPVKEAFREIFPRMTGEQLYEITEKIRDLTAKFKISESQSAKLKSTFKGLFSIIKMGTTIIKSVVSGVVQLAGKLLGLGGGILDITSSLGDWVSKVSESITETNLFGKAINGIVGFLGKGIDKLKEFGSHVKDKFKAPGFETFLNILKSVLGSIKKVGAAVVKVASSIGKALANAFHNGDMKSLLDLVNGGIFTTILLGLKKWIKGFKDFASEGKSFVGNINDVLDKVGESLTTWQKNIKADILKKIAISIGILAASLWVLSTIDSDRLGSALAGITVLFIELVGAIKAFDKLDVKATGASKAVMLMVGMSTAVLILASGMKKIANLNWNEIAKGLTGIAGLMTIAVGAMVALSKFASSSEKVFSISKKGIFSAKKKKDFVSMGVSLIAIAASMKIFASAAKDLSSMNWVELAKGVSGIGVILAEVVGFMGLMKLIKPEKMTSTGIALIAIAASMKIFASAAKDFASMDWQSLGKAGAAIGGILTLAAGFGKLSSYSGKMISSSIALIIIGASMEIFADVCKKFGQLEWQSLGKAGAAIGGILILAAGFTLLSGLSKKLTRSVIALTIIAGAMEIFADVCKKFGQMDWQSLAKAGAAIGGILALTAGFVILCNLAKYDMIETAGSLLVMAAALRVLTPVLTTLGEMSIAKIAKSLITLAGALGILIGAAALITYFGLAPALFALAGAVALFGIGCAAAGVGIMALAAGLGTLASITAAGATAIVAALHIVIVGILELIPSIIDALTDAVVALCNVFIRSVPAICEAVKVLILEVINVLVECIPAIVDGALKLVVGVIDALVQYTPQIVDLIFNFLIAILDGIAKNLPKLIQSVVDVFKALFSGVIDALNSMDPDMLVKGILGIGFMSAMMLALAAMAALTPAAMIGVVGFGAVITELAGVLAVLGGLEQIPGLEWLISEGGDFLEKIGTAIGKFIGGIAGGIAEGFTSSLPNIATDLSTFMTNIKPFIAGASLIDSSVFDGVKALATAIMYLTAADVVNGIASWLTGGSSMADFAAQLVPFGIAMSEYSKAVVGIDSGAIESSASAGKMLAELASTLPNSGGVAGFFAGENDMDIFAAQLVPFGTAMKEYSDAVSGIDPESIQNSSVAAKSLVELANNLPNTGGLVSFFTGDNQLGAFAEQLIPFGQGMKAYADGISGMNAESVTASATAGSALVELANKIPNCGGLVSWFTGDNQLGDFAEQLIPFGQAMKEYGDSISGMDSEAITNSAIAAEALVELAENLPNSGGLVSWFTGDNKLDSFGEQLVPLGEGMKEYADSISGMDADAVTNSATAGMALVKLADSLPNCGGLVSWFTGDNKLDSFAEQLIEFGKAMKKYGENVSGIDAAAVEDSATAGMALVKLAEQLPNCGGAISFFTGDNELSTFAENLIPFGTAMKKYGENVSGMDTNAIEASAIAGSSLVKLAEQLPNTGGLAEYFTGEGDLAAFAEQLIPFGDSMKKYGENIVGMDTEAITASATAGSALVELAAKLPNCGGAIAFFAGDNELSVFAEQLAPFGKAMKDYGDAIAGMDSEAITASASAGSALVELATKIPNCGGVISFFTGDNDLSAFGEQIIPFGKAMKDYGDAVSGIDEGSITASATAGSALVELAAKLPNSGGVVSFFTGEADLSKFGEQIIPFGKAMKEYGDAVSGIDADSIASSATAGSALVELADKVPNCGGAITFFTGDNDLSGFGEQLVPFGKAMKDYADSISGMDADAVTNSASAAKSLAELATNLPNTGGLVSWFTGDNDLGSFGGQLKTFGECMKAYSDSVTGINIEAVTNSVESARSLNGVSTEISTDGGLFDLFNGNNDFATICDELVSFGSGLTRYSAAIVGMDADAISNSAIAAESLSKVATSIQNGNILSIFSGEGVLSGFSLQLPTFGKNLKAYSDSVIGVDASAVTNSATATDALVVVASNIYKLSMFTGEGTLDIFSTQLTPFGRNLKAYSANVAGIDVASIYNSASAAKELVTVMNSMSNLNTSGVSSFVESLKSLGTVSVDGFVNAFNNAGGKVSTAISSMFEAGIRVANSRVASFTTIGNNVVRSLSNGMNSGSSMVTNFVSTLLNNVISAIRNKVSMFSESGKQLILAFSSGLRSQSNNAKSVTSMIADGCASKFRDKYNSFYNAGSYLVDGFVAGIDENTWKAEAEAAAMAAAALEAAKEALGIQSPSKEFYKVGDFAGQGLVNAMYDCSGKVSKAGGSMADYAVKGLTNAISKVKDALDSDMDSTPTIRPVLDLSNVQNGVGTLSGMMNQMNGFTLSGSVAMAQQTLASMNSSRAANRAFEDQMNDSITSLNESIKELRADVAKQYEASQTVPEVNLYMDSRKMASSLAKPMDKELSTLAKRRK